MAIKEYSWLTLRLLAAMCATTMFPSNIPAGVSAGSCDRCAWPCGPKTCGPWHCTIVTKENKEGWTDCNVYNNGQACDGETTCKWVS